MKGEKTGGRKSLATVQCTVNFNYLDRVVCTHQLINQIQLSDYRPTMQALPLSKLTNLSSLSGILYTEKVCTVN